jgi:hypothetical protein
MFNRLLIKNLIRPYSRQYSLNALIPRQMPYERSSNRIELSDNRKDQVQSHKQSFEMCPIIKLQPEKQMPYEKFICLKEKYLSSDGLKCLICQHQLPKFIQNLDQ